MHIDLYVALAGLIVGFAVGLTGMGGGALMTPILVLLFGIAPIAAVSSDLVASLFMKPDRRSRARRTRHGALEPRRLARARLCPSAFLGVVFLKSIGSATEVQNDRERGARRCAPGRRPGAADQDVPRSPQRHLRWRRREVAHQEGADTRHRGIDRVHRRDHVGGFRNARDHPAAVPVPPPSRLADGRDGPGAGDPDGRLGCHRAHHLRRLQARSHPVDPDREHPRGPDRRERLVLRADRVPSRCARGRAARLRAQARERADPCDRDRAARLGHRPRHRVGVDPPQRTDAARDLRRTAVAGTPASIRESGEEPALQPAGALSEA